MSGPRTLVPLSSAPAAPKSGAGALRSRGTRRGAALTLVFVSVLATGAATGSWFGEPVPGGGADRDGAGVPVARTVADTDTRTMRDDRVAEGGEAGSLDADEAVSRSGDRWSTAYSAREYEGYQQALSGEYIGVGISVRRLRGGAIEVAGVQPGSPAERAGVRRGDRLRAIDGTAVHGRPVTEVVARLRGPDRAAGSRVVLQLRRDGRQWQQELRRATLQIRTVTVSRPSEDITRIKITSFTEGSGDQVRRAVEKLPAGSAVLLDLRGNSGGLVAEAVTVASAFLDGGLVATYGVHGSQRALYAEPGGDTEVPLVVLVDGGTMSSAELLTGALQDRGRAVVVGSPTFGKGAVQLPSEQPDGSVAELTVGEYATPLGHTVEGQGITPDLEVSSRDDAESEARGVLRGLHHQ